MVAGPVVNHLLAILRVITRRARGAWRRYRALRPRMQIVIGVAAAVILLGLIILLGGGKKDAAAPTLRTVTLQPLGQLAGAQASSTVLGTIRSVTEAEILAQADGTVRSVNTALGRSVPAGFVIAELDNSSERAAVLQAEGAYDAALASREAVSPEDAATAARNAYRDAFTSLETAFETGFDALFGAPTPAGPDLLINPPGSDPNELPRARADLNRMMEEWRRNLATAETRDPETLIDEAEAVARAADAFGSRLSEAANRTGSRATAEQITALAGARASVSGVVSAIAGARVAYRSGSTSSTSSVDAGVKSALGNLRFAQANLEKTVVRAPIAGTVNYLPLRVGDYVTPLQHVATVAQNGALEAVAFVSEDARAGLAVGTEVAVDGHPGVITAISPALDPVTKQIEVRVALDAGASLVNGQAVHVSLPESVAAATSSASASGVRLLPLTAVKLAAGSRVIFMLNEEGRLAAIPVIIGDVRGDRIEVMTDLPDDARVVTDARGLSEGQAVNVAQ